MARSVAVLPSIGFTCMYAAFALARSPFSTLSPPVPAHRPVEPVAAVVVAAPGEERAGVHAAGVDATDRRPQCGGADGAAAPAGRRSSSTAAAPRPRTRP